ncbi:Insulin gene enhancer protein ISL-3 [Liparis tanakae]|uniref:Insulin gene enhancer protein ISL-3 n=1 Tax=Liparis tanakae TaxID=230148 RepID=A0A4Z2E0B8_9TELE|nr:Insulin gene enhancer protein ISL-3 [Liparis tanakae]
MKQLQQQHHSDKSVSIFNLQGLTGTPLVAGSPIRHESSVQGNPVEVQTYQPPWKALSEFALQSDLDQPAFQQLVCVCVCVFVYVCVCVCVQEILTYRC